MDGVNLTDCSTCEHDTNEYNQRCVECMTTLKHHYQPKIAHKHDADKPRLGLCPPGIIEAVGIIRDYGTRKYGNPDGWKLVEPHRYVDALMRHLVAYMRDPGGIDAESGHSHLWHMACNVAFLIEFENGIN